MINLFIENEYGDSILIFFLFQYQILPCMKTTHPSPRETQPKYKKLKIPNKYIFSDQRILNLREDEVLFQ